MNSFALHNKLDGPMRFDIPSDFPFDRLPESGIIPVPAILDSKIGTETVLFLFDKTPFIYELAKVQPFDLMLKTGVVRTSHGPVMFLLFWVPQPGNVLERAFIFDVHVNPFDSRHVIPWRDLSRQTHWHVILLDANCEQVNLFEFQNVYDLGPALDLVAEVCEREPHRDFDLAKRELMEKYSLASLFGMS